MAAPKAIIMMADYGHDPTGTCSSQTVGIVLVSHNAAETAIPYYKFRLAGFEVHFATETGNSPACDSRMLQGVTGKLLGAPQEAKTQYEAMLEDPAVQKPRSWTDPAFSLEPYDLVFFPGGHDKGVRQIIDSERVHELLAAYFPQTKRSTAGKKSVAAVCHGVMVVAGAEDAEGRSVLHDVTTTALPHAMEEGIFWSTRLFLGDYYKTYGAGSDSVEKSVKKKLDAPEKQWKGSLGFAPFVVEDGDYNYISARFPPDAEMLGDKVVEMVKKAVKG